MSPLSALKRHVESFHPANVPPLSRPHFSRELRAWFFLAVMMGTVEGGVTSVLAKTAFEGQVDPWLLNAAVAVLAGAPAYANITSFLWSGLSRGREKIRFLRGLQLAAVILIGQVAFAPDSVVGLLMLVIAGVGGRICWAGVATLRATVWRANYPREMRASLTGKFATIQAIMLATVSLALGAMLEWDASSFRYVYPAAALVGAIGAAVYGGLRMRGHKSMLRAERDDAQPMMHAVSPKRLLEVLQADRPFRRYMIAMFIFGTGNLAIMAPMVVMLRDRFGMDYLAPIMITTTIPIVVMPLAIPLWSKLLDRVHIVRFRVYHCWAFITTNVVVLIAAALGLPVLLWIAAVCRGIAFGGGVLGWNLGHLDFAPPDRTSEYMGVHVTLTGVRGAFAPAAAVAIYALLEAQGIGYGAWVFAGCLVLNLTGSAMFYALARSHESKADTLPS